MTDSYREDPAQLEQWSAEVFGQKLLAPESAGSIFVLEGLSPSKLQRETPDLRRVLGNANLPLFILDPTGKTGTGATFFDILVEYVERARGRGRISEKARRLFEFVSTNRDADGARQFSSYGTLHAGSLCRLWTSLSEEWPAVLMVVNAHRCTPSEVETLEHLTHFFFADPIAQLGPETEAIEQGHGRLVYVRDDSDFPIELEAISTVDVDCSLAAEQTVRQYLSDPKVVQRFLKSTGGDPERLDDLVEALPENVEHFLLHRYRQLDEREQHIVNALAVTRDALSLDRLHAVLTELDSADYLARTMRNLVEMGILDRKVGAGFVEVRVESSEFAASVVETLDEGERTRIHTALAETALDSDGDDPSPVFLARHFLAGGDVERGFEFGKEAVRRLLNRRDYDRATDLLAEIVPYADTDGERVQLHKQLVVAHRALGHYEKALTHCDVLDDLVDSPAERARLGCERGHLLLKLGEYDAALELFAASADAVDSAEESFEIWSESKLGEGEVLYAQGHQERAADCGLAVIERVERLQDATSKLIRARDRALIRARNLIAKVNIIGRQCRKARKLLVKNESLAEEWGWTNEIARARANLGLVALEEKDYDEARSKIQFALDTAHSPEVIQRAYTLVNLGIVHQKQHAFRDALRHYLESLRASQRNGDEVTYFVAAHNLVTLYTKIGAFERGLSLIEHVQNRRTDATEGYFVGPQAFQVLYANILLNQGRYVDALDAFARIGAEKPHNEAQRLAAAQTHLRMTEAHLELGQMDAAERIVEEVDFPEDGDAQPQFCALLKWARASIALAKGNPQLALDVSHTAAEQARAGGTLQDKARIQLLHASALRADDRDEEARVFLEEALQDARQIAREIPEAHRQDFYSARPYQRLVALAGESGATVPGPFELDISESKPRAAEQLPDHDDPNFRRWRSRYGDIVGESTKLHQLFRIVDRVASSPTPVLVQGESGTGKELLAEAIHEQSGRSDGPLIKVNCAAFVDDLLLSELFGHEKGAFTGAVSEKAGRFARADGGTIFLDEIGDISPKTQVALLRVLQEGTFEKVGGTETKQVDVRVICATNKDLEAMVESGEFRLDLYYRLKGVILDVPPLRERRQDIPHLVQHFGRQFSEEDSEPIFSKEVVQFLSSYSWPGNVRELKNLIQNVLLFVEGNTVQMPHLKELGEFFSDGQVDLDLPDVEHQIELPSYDDVGETYEDPQGALVARIVGEGLSLSEMKKRLELDSIRSALTETGGNITQAAKILQMKRPRLSQIVNSTEELLALKDELVD